MGMKLKLQDTPKEMKIFTDRTEPQFAFKNKYNKLKSGESVDEPHVLTFYGVGGIGKTELLKKLRKSLDDGLVKNNEKTVEKPFYIYYEFTKDKSLEPVEILYKFAQQLFKKYNFRFNLFEMGYCCVNDKEPQEKSNISDNIGLALDALAMIPTLNLPAGIANITSGVYDRLKSQKSQNAFEELKTSFEYLDSKERTAELINLFVIDLRINMDKFSKKNKEPLVVFLDTYERLVDETQTIGEPLNNDIWLRGDEGLIQKLQNVLWVISGREKLKWIELGRGWEEATEDNLEQYLLKNFSKQDSMNYLQSAGITEDSLRERLYELTQGMPLFLNLCVEFYYKNENHSLENFGKSSNELIERFLIYMDDGMKQNIYILACLESWDEELFDRAYNSFNTEENVFLFPRLMGMSFVRRDTENCYSIDRVVGSVLFNGCPQRIKEKTLDTAIKYYSEKLKNIKTLSNEGYSCLKRLLDYAVKHFSNDNELNDFYHEDISGNLYLYIDNARFADAESIMSSFAKRAEQNKTGILYAEKLYFDSSLKCEMGNCTEKDILLPAQQAYDLYNSILGEDNAETLAALNQVSLCYLRLGKYESARGLQEQLLEKYKEFSGENHPDTLLAMNNLAVTYSNLGRYEETLELQKQVFEKRKVISGENHHETLRAMNNLATTYNNFGRNEEALELQKQVLEKRKEILGENHPDTLTAINNLATTYNNLGGDEEALELQKQVLEKRKEILGENHPDTLGAMNNLAMTYRKLGKYKEALELYKQVFEKSQGFLGEEHPDTLISMSNLATTYRYLGRYEKALEFEKQVYEKRKEILSENHPDTLGTMNNLAMIYEELGKYKEALDLQKQVFEKHKEILGVNHPQTLAAMNNLTSTYYALARFEEALDFQKQVLEKCKVTLGENHRDTLTAMNNLATTYRELGKYNKALELQKQVLEKSKEILGEEHPDTLSAMNNFAITYRELGKYKEALELHKLVLEKSKEILGEEHPNTLGAMDNLAMTYKELGKYKEALELQKQVVEKHKEILGEGNPQTLATMNNLTSTYYALARYEEALDLQKQVLEKCKEILGEIHHNTLTAMNNLAMTYRELGKYKKALELHKQVLKKYKEILGEEHPNTLIAMNNLAATYRDLRKYKEALKLHKQVLEKSKEILGEEHPDTLLAINNLALTYNALGMYEEASKLFREVAESQALEDDTPLKTYAKENLDECIRRLTQAS